MAIGIICAMEEEIALLEQDIQSADSTIIAGRTFIQGTLYGQEAVLVMSRIGKVAVAVTTTLLIERFHVSQIVFAGTAGAVAPELKVGDVVVANQSVQHDMRPDEELTFRVPVIEVGYFQSDPELTQKAFGAVEEYINNSLHNDIPQQHLQQFGIRQPKVVVGTIASGDEFVCDPAKNTWLYEHIDNLKCVEMEGAAMAQVCYEYGIPFTILRVISDCADNDTPFTFDSFIEGAAKYFTRGSIRALLQA